MYATQSILLPKYQINLLRTISLRTWAVIFREEEAFFFRTCHFSLFFAEPLYQNVRIVHRILSLFCRQVTNHCETRVESWFVLFSLIPDLSVYFNYLSRITFGNTNREFYSLLLLISVPYWYYQYQIY